MIEVSLIKRENGWWILYFLSLERQVVISECLIPQQKSIILDMTSPTCSSKILSFRYFVKF